MKEKTEQKNEIQTAKTRFERAWTQLEKNPTFLKSLNFRDAKKKFPWKFWKFLNDNFLSKANRQLEKNNEREKDWTFWLIFSINFFKKKQMSLKLFEFLEKFWLKVFS